MRRKDYELEKTEAWLLLLLRILSFRIFRLGAAWSTAGGPALFPEG